MISGATQSPSASLLNSTQQYRAQLDQRRNSADKTADVQAQKTPDVTLPVENPIEKTPIPEGGDLSIDYEKLNAAIESNRDTARQAAVGVFAANHKQNLVDIYANASSDGEKEKTTPMIEPAEAYKASLDYSQRDDLLKAFEAISNGDTDRPNISILV